MMGPTAPVMHSDLSKYACGQNFTNEAGSAFNDLSGHGTHVVATIAGTGTANPRYRGVAPGVGEQHGHPHPGRQGHRQREWPELLGGERHGFHVPVRRVRERPTGGDQKRSTSVAFGCVIACVSWL